MAEPNPSVPNSGGPPPNSSGAPPNIQKLVASKRLQQAQAQVGEVVDIMRVNVEKVLERDQKLSEMDRRADELQEGASQFQQHAVKLKKKYWWENFKMWIIIGVVVLIVILVIVITSTGGVGTASTPVPAGEVVSAANNAEIPDSGKVVDSSVGGTVGAPVPPPPGSPPSGSPPTAA